MSAEGNLFVEAFGLVIHDPGHRIHYQGNRNCFGDVNWDWRFRSEHPGPGLSQSVHGWQTLTKRGEQNPIEVSAVRTSAIAASKINIVQPQSFDLSKELQRQGDVGGEVIGADLRRIPAPPPLAIQAVREMMAAKAN